MKNSHSILSSICVLVLSACASSPKPVPAPAAPAAPQTAWSLSDPAIQNPESVYYHPGDKTLYVSSVAGAPDGKDGKGWISRVDPATGKVLAAQLVAGLNAPKGIRGTGNTLYVSDIDRVIKIDLPSAKIVKKIAIKGAKFLNDVVIGPEGEVYVSDMMTGLVHVIRRDRPSVFVKDPEGQLPNGLLIRDGALIVNTWGVGMKPDFSTDKLGGLYSYDLKTKTRTVLAPQSIGHLDGMEYDAAGNLFLSDWMSGQIRKVDGTGNATLFVNGKQGTADVGYIPDTKLLVVPQMMESRLDAYPAP